MKNLIAFLGLTTLMALAACKDKVNDPEVVAPSPDNAALRLYYKYAEDPNLTVAFMGDFCLNGNKIDALMIQANEEADWETLKQDFGMMPSGTAAMNCPNDDNPVMVGVGIETDFLDEAVLDTLTDISQIPEKDIEKFTLIVADKIREIMKSFQAPDSLLPNTAIIIGQGEIEHEVTDNTYDDYILTVSRAIVVGLINEKIQANTSPNPSLQQQKEFGDRIMDDAQSHGHMGYITAADYDNRTLWLFFYDDQEECNTIITHISEDIIIN